MSLSMICCAAYRHARIEPGLSSAHTATRLRRGMVMLCQRLGKVNVSNGKYLTASPLGTDEQTVWRFCTFVGSSKRSGRRGWPSCQQRCPAQKSTEPSDAPTVPPRARDFVSPERARGSSLDTLRSPRSSRDRSRVPTRGVRARVVRATGRFPDCPRASLAPGRRQDPEPRGTRELDERRAMVGADPRRTKSEAICDDGTPRASSANPRRATNQTTATRASPFFPFARSLTPSARAASPSSQTRRCAGSAWTITRMDFSDRASARAGCVFLPRDPRRLPPPSCHREASSRSLATATGRPVRPVYRARRADESRTLVVPSWVPAHLPLPPRGRVPDPSLAPSLVRRRCTRDAWRAGSFVQRQVGRGCKFCDAVLPDWRAALFRDVIPDVSLGSPSRTTPPSLRSLTLIPHRGGVKGTSSSSSTTWVFGASAHGTGGPGGVHGADSPSCGIPEDKMPA